MARKSAPQLKARQSVAIVRFVFIGDSDRSVKADCTGCTGTIGYSVRSEINRRRVELKCDGYDDAYGFATSAGIRAAGVSRPDCAIQPAAIALRSLLSARSARFWFKKNSDWPPTLTDAEWLCHVQTCPANIQSLRSEKKAAEEKSLRQLMRVPDVVLIRCRYDS